MAVSEVLLSMAMAILRMWYTLTPGLVPIQETSRNLSEVLVLGADAMTTSIRAVLLIEWTVVVVQSALFFGLFALRPDFINCAISQVSAASAAFKSRLRKIRGGGKVDRGVLIDSSQ